MNPACFAKKVLVVEGSDEERTRLSGILKRAGLAPIEATDGFSALHLFREEKPDLVILDALLPVMDGLQVLKRIKAGPVSRRTPVILMTARDEDGGKTIGGHIAGADFYLAKPYNVANLLSVIERSLTGGPE